MRFSDDAAIQQKTEADTAQQQLQYLQRINRLQEQKLLLQKQHLDQVTANARSLVDGVQGAVSRAVSERSSPVYKQMLSAESLISTVTIWMHVLQMCTSFVLCRGQPIRSVLKFQTASKRCVWQEISCLKRSVVLFHVWCNGFRNASRLESSVSNAFVGIEELCSILFSVVQKEELSREVQLLQETKKVGFFAEIFRACV